MDVFSQYVELLSNLKKKLSFHYSVSYSKRDFPKIAVLEEEIKDVEYALTLMSKANNFSCCDDGFLGREYF